MFCPKCGNTLVWRWNAHMHRDVFYCIPGDMEASVYLTEQLLERFSDQQPAAEAHALPASGSRSRAGFPWYCPGCGVPLGEGMRCDRCGKDLHGLVHILVELHPHRGDYPLAPS
jgi:hypothetical protein